MQAIKHLIRANLSVKIIQRFIAVIICLQTGCSTTYNHTKSEIEQGKTRKYSTPAVQNMRTYLSDPPQQVSTATSWWEDFNDQALNKLIETALAFSFRIQTQHANLDAIKSQLRSVQAARLPSFDLNISTAIEDRDVESNDFRSSTLAHEIDYTGRLAWQTDLFGRINALAHSAEAEVGAANATLKDIQRLLIQEVIENYFRLRATEAQKQLSMNNIIRRTQHADRINRLIERGYATVLDKSRTNNLLQQSHADSLALDIELVRICNILALLTGQNLESARALMIKPTDKKTSTEQTLTRQLKTKLPELPEELHLPNISQFIHHRPDLRAAEFALLSQAFTVDAAKAARYPSLGISSSLSQEGIRLGDWPSLNGIIARISTNLTAPIFGRGQILAAIDLESSNLQAAHTNYEQTMANALAEIDNAITGVIKAKLILARRKLAAASAEKAAGVSYDLFQAGEVDYTSVIVAEQTRSDAEQRAINAQLNSLVYYVQYKSAAAPFW